MKQYQCIRKQIYEETQSGIENNLLGGFGYMKECQECSGTDYNCGLYYPTRDFELRKDTGKMRIYYRKSQNI